MSIPQPRHIAVHLGADGVLLLKYNRPEAGNAINNVVIKNLREVLQWAVLDPRVKVIVQTGEGKFFSTGMDLSAAGYSAQGPEDLPGVLHEMVKLLIDCPKVTIAAINGPGVGYGASSIGLFDLTYAVPDSYFFTPFVKWGLCAEACSSVTFTNTLGRQRASHLVFTSGRVTAQELEAAGLVSKVLPREDFLDHVLSIARDIAHLPAESVRVNKQLLAKPWKKQLHEANEIECLELRRLLATEDAKKAAENFAAEQARKKEAKAASPRHRL